MKDLGNIALAVLHEWQGSFMTREALFPGVDRSVWEEGESWLAPDFWEPQSEAMPMFFSTYLIESDGRKIVVDTGVGNDKKRLFPQFTNMKTNFLDRMAEAGFGPDQVDLVVCSHLHSDHVGWNTKLVDGEWVPTFPNARYLLPQRDFDFWNPESGYRARGAAAAEGVFEDSVLPLVQHGLVDLWDGDTCTVDSNIVLISTPGHTPGNAIVSLDTGVGEVLLVGDLLHNALQLERPHLHSCFDEDSSIASVSRRAVLARAATEGAIVMPNHVGGEQGCVLRQSGSHFDLEWRSVI
ncbi:MULTISPECIES: MBL fold metallo-hydrolase [unclassified Rhodococcus (in: high G+C Gram-positive bacteria)]|uniref:MBL fold metallo-hydrolase n=1 Tax=unclassified Rhodococcus (in: high G+C Gram-positive bacteria) TaxID=192944 RepID=UPI001681A8C1|nr:MULTISPECIES: MBL fold metallo-hydrolase [unclassified Rhodococcus (in: high G+C Gram-positive bacteria)]